MVIAEYGLAGSHDDVRQCVGDRGADGQQYVTEHYAGEHTGVERITLLQSKVLAQNLCNTDVDNCQGQVVYEHTNDNIGSEEHGHECIRPALDKFTCYKPYGDFVNDSRFLQTYIQDHVAENGDHYEVTEGVCPYFIGCHGLGHNQKAEGQQTGPVCVGCQPQIQTRNHNSDNTNTDICQPIARFQRNRDDNTDNQGDQIMYIFFLKNFHLINLLYLSFCVVFCF